MATTKKDKKNAAKAKAEVTSTKESKNQKGFKGGKKKTLTEEEKKAKREARKEALKNRPDGQRTNSKQIDIIETKNGSVEVFGATVRKVGTLITAIALDSDGNVVGVSTSLVEGVKVKCKKGHGTLVPGVAGVGKRGKNNENDSDDDDSEDEDED